MSKIRLFSSLTLASVLPFCVMAAQNEISLGITDQDFIDDTVIDFQYLRYLQDVENNGEPSLIAPYLQRVDNVGVRINTSGDLVRYEVSGEWFVNQDFVLSGDLRYHDVDDPQMDYWYSGDVSFGYFVNPNLQIGTGVFYQRASGERTLYTVVDDEADPIEWTSEEVDFSDSDSASMLFSRYTDVVDGKGWDMNAQVIFDDDTRIDLNATYFFSPQLSLGGGYTRIQRDQGYRYYSRNSDIVSLGGNYWFTDAFSMTLGFGAYVGDDESGLANLDLIASYRF